MENIEMLSVKEISKILGIGINQTYELVKKEGFPSFRVGQKFLVPKEKFEEWINEQCTRKI